MSARRRLAAGLGAAACVVLAACDKPAAPPAAPHPPVASLSVVLAPKLGVSASVSPAQAMQQPWVDRLTVPLLKGGSRTLRNCVDFFAVSTQVSDVIDESAEQVLLGQAVRCEALKAVEGGRPAAKSFVSGWKLDDAGWRIAPPAFDFQFSPDGQAEVRRVTAQGGSAADLEKVSFSAQDAFRVDVTGSGWSGEFTVLARGLDVNGDGVEDLIVSRNAAATSGTLRAITYFVVTRLAPTGPMRVLRSFP